MTPFAFLIAPGVLAGSVGASLDVLGFANRCGAPEHTLTWQVLAPTTPVALTGGMQLAATPLHSAQLSPDGVLIIPGIGLTEAGDIHERYADTPLLARMQAPDAIDCAALAARHHAAGGRVAASCTGVLLLAMAGVLDGRQATTHWRLGGLHAPALSARARR